MRIAVFWGALTLALSVVWSAVHQGDRRLPIGAPVPDQNNLPRDEWVTVRAIDQAVYPRYKYQLETFTRSQTAKGSVALHTRMHILNTDREGAIVEIICFPLSDLDQSFCDFGDKGIADYDKMTVQHVLVAAGDGQVRGYPLEEIDR